MWKELKSMREKKWNVHYKRNSSLVGGYLPSLNFFLRITVWPHPSHHRWTLSKKNHKSMQGLHDLKNTHYIELSFKSPLLCWLSWKRAFFFFSTMK